MKKRKAMKRLDVRRKDYDKMVSQTGKDYSGYRRPGSLNK